MKKILILLLMTLSSFAFAQLEEFQQDTLIESFNSNTVIFYNGDSVSRVLQINNFIELNARTIYINEKYYGKWVFVGKGKDQSINLLVLVPNHSGKFKYEEWSLITAEKKKAILVIRKNGTLMYWYEEPKYSRT